MAASTPPAGKPPTVLEFRDMARKAPRKAFVELPGPPADPDKVAAELAKLAALTARKKDSTGRDEKAWAKRLMARHQAGDSLKPIQLRFAREAMGIRTEARAA